MDIVNKMKLTEILNERVLIDEILENHYMDETNTYRILGLLAKHFYYDLGYKERKTIKALDEYMIGSYPGYTAESINEYVYMGRRGYSPWERSFRRCYKRAVKSPIKEINGIWITQAELDKIAELENKRLEKLAFVCLCYAKLNIARNEKSQGWIYNNKFSDIFKHSHISGNKTEKTLLLCELEKNGYLQLYQFPTLTEREKQNPYIIEKIRKRQNDYRVLFIDNDSPGAIYIDDWNDLAFYYLQYRGENMIKCKKCGKLTPGNKNGTKQYCKECAGKGDKPKNNLVIARFYKCSDCGKLIPLYSNEHAKKRCQECAALERKEHNRKMYEQRKQRNAENSTKL